MNVVGKYRFIAMSATVVAAVFTSGRWSVGRRRRGSAAPAPQARDAAKAAVADRR